MDLPWLEPDVHLFPQGGVAGGRARPHARPDFWRVDNAAPRVASASLPPVARRVLPDVGRALSTTNSSGFETVSAGPSCPFPYAPQPVYVRPDE